MGRATTPEAIPAAGPPESGPVSPFSAQRLRVFASAPGGRRFRRATDLILLLGALILLAIITAAYPPGPFERSIIRLFHASPSWFDPVWGFVYDLTVLWAAALLVTLAVARRWQALLQVILALGLAALVSLGAGRIALGRTPDIVDALRRGAPGPAFPGVRLALVAAVVLTISAQLVRPLQRVNRWLLAFGFAGALVLGQGSPSSELAGLMVAVVAASSVRLAFGTSDGRPRVAEVAAALGSVGVEATGLELSDRQVRGIVSLHAVDPEKRRLVVKVLGRDAYDNQLLEKFWRLLWYQDPGPSLRLSRLQVAEHEALLTLLARSNGVAAYEVVRVATAADDSALLVLRGDARPLASFEPDASLLPRLWSALERLAAANVAHGRIDPDTVALFRDEAGFVDFGSATASPSADALLTDRAQLLVTTATRFGSDAALAAALGALGSDGIVSLLPYLQVAALDESLHEAASEADVDVDDLRAQAAKLVEAEEPQLVRLRRVTWSSAIQVGLLLLAAAAVLSFATGIDYEQFRAGLADAIWGWIVVGFVVAQLPRLTQAVSTLGSVPAQLRYGPVYAMQLATGYMNLALPSVFARLAINIRFFQRQGVPPAAAVTAGAIDSAVSTVCQAVLLVLLLVFSESELHLEFTAPSGGLQTVAWILVGLLVAVVLAVALTERLRRLIVDRVRTWWPQVRAALGTLRSSNKLAMLLVGSVATEVLFAVALGIFALGFGTRIGLTDLLVINIGVSLFSSLIPVPGGIGVTELGLTIGLTSAGMSEAAALGAVLFYRIATFYLPPVWGFLALRWLQKNRYL
jgi:glycosyltransferase 2 family protein